jgi:hypothetical protein
MAEKDPAKIAARRERLAKIYRSQPSLTFDEVRDAIQRHTQQSGMLPSSVNCAPSANSQFNAMR